MFDKLNFLFTPDDPPAGDPPKSDNPPAADPVTPLPDGGGEGKKEYTQAELDTMFADRAKRAGSKSLTDLYADLGLTAKELKALVVGAKKKEDDDKSELEKAQGVASEWEKKHTVLEASQKLDRVRYAVESEARKQKVIPDAVPDVFALVDVSSLEFGDDGMPQGVDDAVKAVLKTRAHMIQANGAARTDNDATKGTGGAPTGGHTDAELEQISSDYGVALKYIKQGLSARQPNRS